jgi:hypothetical protein
METSKLKQDILAGRDIFEKIPNDQRPRWAKVILFNFDDYIKNIPSEVSELISIIDDKERWREAHAQFSKIRQFVLRHKAYKPEAYLLLAEKVAKVTYNASGQPAPFDSDSGWWIPKCALQAASYFADDKLEENILAAILTYQ